jgi:AcrR family transcriptional regulator
MSVVRLTRDERRERTRTELVDAAEARFVEHGFHATSVDQIAADAGYTKGAVYGNFDSKEDLFFAVYERRADVSIDRVERMLAKLEPAAALERLSGEIVGRRDTDDLWLAAFFEFRAHVIRHPELRERFAAIHARAQEPFISAIERLVEESGTTPQVDPRKLIVAANAMHIGLGLERLERPELVDSELGEQMSNLLLESVGLKRRKS